MTPELTDPWVLQSCAFRQFYFAHKGVAVLAHCPPGCFAPHCRLLLPLPVLELTWQHREPCQELQQEGVVTLCRLENGTCRACWHSRKVCASRSKGAGGDKKSCCRAGVCPCLSTVKGAGKHISAGASWPPPLSEEQDLLTEREEKSKN